jgi:hypothetical protein
MLKVKNGDLDKLGLLFERYNRPLFGFFVSHDGTAGAERGPCAKRVLPDLKIQTHVQGGWGIQDLDVPYGKERGERQWPFGKTHHQAPGVDGIFGQYRRRFCGG